MDKAISEPLEVIFGRERIFVHEPGCNCGLDHDGKFTQQDGKVAMLTVWDETTNQRFYQIWWRTGKWGLQDAIQMLLERKKKNIGGRAA